VDELREKGNGEKGKRVKERERERKTILRVDGNIDTLRVGENYERELCNWLMIPSDDGICTWLVSVCSLEMILEVVVNLLM